ncbi:N-acetylglucosamine-6-phosphate deacetylase [Flavihumibacter solisilvae]|uniref:N-acetylglucosamine-6-phosphate deacetylase n=1 Tax=Flavihumibacter solisilvae TaxID=1349421 RepID=UPI00068C8466|nr:N-acetylglucosamine-6-phosphate deacetylase [Flavihumibacter solisilvae]
MNKEQQICFFNGRIFTGDEWMNQAYITTSDGKVRSIDAIPSDSEGSGAFNEIDLEGGLLVPALIDIQLYGGNGKLFGENPSVEALQATVNYSLSGAAQLILPTVATNRDEVVFAAIDAVRQYWNEGGKGVAGLHLEGPFLNPQKKGAHAADHMQEPTIKNIEKFLNYGRGVVRMMTIAPELFSDEAIYLLQSAGVILSAGHSNATYEQANAAFARGINVCTHLFNAMSPLSHRAPGLVGAILDHPAVMSSIVADGYHVDIAAIRIAKQVMKDRLFLITDAVTENESGYYRHQLKGDRYCMPDGTLSGSALTMLSAVRFCIDKVGIEESEAFRMASLYPAKVLGLEKELGKIAPGYNAQWSWIGVHDSVRPISLHEVKEEA